MEIGDHVFFVKIHPNHNKYLKRRLNQIGRIRSIGGFEMDEYLVEFLEDPFNSSFWIKEKYLKPKKLIID